MKEYNTIETLSEFHEMVCSYSANHPIYRGLKRSDYSLISRFGRSVIENKKERKKGFTKYVVDEFVEKNALEEFKKKSVPYLTHIPSNDWEWLTIAQNYGLPTRLLDWTTNPLIAAFFACVDNENSTDAAIYILTDEYSIEDSNLDISPFESNAVSILRPFHTADRIKSQLGLFTVHPSPEKVFKHKNLHKCNIKFDCFYDIQLMLERYGVSYSSVLPGMDGIAKDLIERYGL